MIEVIGAYVRAAALVCVSLGMLDVVSQAAADEPKPLRVCLVSGSLEYKSNESLAALQKYLEEHYQVECSRAFLPGKAVDDLPGLENLEKCDVMLLFTRRLKLSGEQLERFKAYCLGGKPIVGVRTASHAVDTWLALDKEVFGGNYQNHYGAGQTTEIKIAAGAEKNPLLAGFQPFRSSGSLYKNAGLAPDVTVLMTGIEGENVEPITWTREYRGGRIFYTSLGHPDDFQQESFRRLLANALFWTARREPVAPASGVKK